MKARFVRTIQKTSKELKVKWKKSSAQPIHYTKTESKLTVAKGYPSVYNDDELMDTVTESSRRADLSLELLKEPYLFGEDFSFYSSIAKTNFAFLGVRNEEKGFIHGLHTALFNFDEAMLEKGVYYYQSILHTLGALT
ncbi:MAG: M20/M25/M40 family metallo-hydrolase [Alkalibacterium thalassium]|nr:M20/M25/M40 family metallo-hydrolase [Alkalibacterium thalassium]